MKVISLFDGISCGQSALRNILGKDTNIEYFASEIDEQAIAVTQYNFPNTKQLGSVVDVNVDELKKEGDFDILIWGSPCTNLSVSWNRTGLIFHSLDYYLKEKEKGFKQGQVNNQSYLFWEYVRILHQLRPKFFLLENVVMKKENEKIITENLFWVEPVLIDSKLVSAQSRKRLYWIGKRVGNTYEKVNIELPPNQGICLEDILLPFDKVWPDYYLKQYSPFFFNENYLDSSLHFTKQGMALRTRGEGKNLEVRKDNKSNCLTTVINDSLIKVAFFNKGAQADRIYSIEWKSVCLQAGWWGRGGKTWIYAIEKDSETLKNLYKNVNTINQKDIVKQLKDYDWIPFFIRKPMPIECEALQTLDTKIVLQTYWNKDAKQEIVLIDSEEWLYRDTTFYMVESKKDLLEKYFTVLNQKEIKDFNEGKIKITVKEVNWYTRYWIKEWKRYTISKSQRYKMIGNGWTQKVIEHIFTFIFYNNAN